MSRFSFSDKFWLDCAYKSTTQIYLLMNLTVLNITKKKKKNRLANLLVQNDLTEINRTILKLSFSTHSLADVPTLLTKYGKVRKKMTQQKYTTKPLVYIGGQEGSILIA